MLYPPGSSEKYHLDVIRIINVFFSDQKIVKKRKKEKRKKKRKKKRKFETNSNPLPQSDNPVEKLTDPLSNFSIAESGHLRNETDFSQLEDDQDSGDTEFELPHHQDSYGVMFHGGYYFI